MEVTIENMETLSWGDPVLVNVDYATAPENAVNYQVLIKINKIISQNQTSLIANLVFSPNQFDNVQCDLAPYIRSAGNYIISFGERYQNVVEGVPTTWESYFVNELDETIELPNTTIIENEFYTVPKGAIQLSGNPIQIMVPTTAPQMLNKTAYKLLLKITCSALIGSPFIEEIAPDQNLLSKFDISGLIDQPVNFDFVFPPEAIATDHRALEFNVSIDTGEKYIDANGSLQETWNNLNANTYFIRVLKGKLRPYELAQLNEVGKNFNIEYINRGKFLTHLPTLQVITPSHIPKFWFLSKYDHIVNATLWCKVFYNPNGKEMDYLSPVGVLNEFLIQEVTLNPASGLLEFNVHPKFFGFQDLVNPDALILAFSFWLQESNETISEIRTFIIDYTNYESIFSFLYVNPLSGIDTIELAGENTETLSVEAETFYQPTPVGATTKTASLRTVSVTGQRSWEINTGYKTKSDLIALRDFLESKDCWMVDTEQPTRLIPVLIAKDKHTIFNSSDDIHSLTVNVIEALR